jgi:hypothetical protein
MVPQPRMPYALYAADFDENFPDSTSRNTCNLNASLYRNLAFWTTRTSYPSVNVQQDGTFPLDVERWALNVGCWALNVERSFQLSAFSFQLSLVLLRD